MLQAPDADQHPACHESSGRSTCSRCWALDALNDWWVHALDHLHAPTGPAVRRPGVDADADQRRARRRQGRPAPPGRGPSAAQSAGVRVPGGPGRPWRSDPGSRGNPGRRVGGGAGRAPSGL